MDGTEAQEWGDFETTIMSRLVWKWIMGDNLVIPFNWLNIRMLGVCQVERT